MKKNLLRLIIWGTFLTVNSCLAGCNQLKHKIETYLNAAHEYWDFHGSVLIAVDGQIIFSKGYGFANQKMGIPNTPQTKFFIGSITKQFTAVAILKLQEKGLLHINDPITKFLPEYPKETGDKITIHHLLCHTSGLPNYTDFPEVVLKRLNPITPREIMKTFMNRPLEFTPGTNFRYSNSGYILLGMIIEAVSGQSYEAYLHHEILKPSGMYNSGYARREAGLPERADGYTLEEQNLVDALPVHFSMLHTAGALYSTVEDMLRWDRALFTDKILSPVSIDKMLTPYFQNYGYGWVIEERYGRKHAFHGGFLDGFNSVFSRWLEDRLCIVVFGNEDIAPVKKMVHGLAAIIFEQPYVFPVKRIPIMIDPELLTDYSGTYLVAPDIYRLVTCDDGKLYTNVLGEPRQQLLPESTDKFFLANDNTVSILFQRDTIQKVNSLILEDDFMIYPAVKLDEDSNKQIMINRSAIELDSLILDRHEGTYIFDMEIESIEDVFTITVTRQGSNLWALTPGNEAVELQASSENEFFHEQADFKIIFVVNSVGRTTGCHLHMGPIKIYAKKID